MDVIGMTNLQEAKLAREAEICYVTVAMVTDYDCWHPHHDSVTVDQIVAVLLKNAENAARVVRETVAAMPQGRACKCGSALAHAILTDRSKIPAATRQKLKLILGKYLEGKPKKHEHTSSVGSVRSIPSPALPASGRRSGRRRHVFRSGRQLFHRCSRGRVVGEDFTAEHENVLKKRGVDTRGIEHAKGKTFRWGGQYHRQPERSQD